MGLGSQNDQTRKAFKGIAGKRDWKADINIPKDAIDYIESVQAILGKDVNGKFLSATYMDLKLRLLRQYIYDVSVMKQPITLKEWERGKKN